MVKQPKIHRPYQVSTFFEDGQSARPLVAGTVAQGQLRTDREYYTGMSGDLLIDRVPAKVDRAFLARGRQRYNINCSPCHGQTGEGRGIIVRRGFPPPPSFHETRLIDAPAGHYYNVITHGFGAMYSYAARVNPDDRWAITAYIRALQVSQNARLGDVPAEDRATLEAEPNRKTKVDSGTSGPPGGTPGPSVIHTGSEYRTRGTREHETGTVRDASIAEAKAR